MSRVMLPHRIAWACERRAFLIGILATPVAAACSLALPLLLGDAVDTLRTSDSQAPGAVTVRVGQLTAAFVGLAVLEGLLRLLARHQLIRASRRVEERIKLRLVDRILRLPISWHDRSGRGDTISRLTQDVELLRFVLGPTILYGAQSVVVVPGGVAIMLAISPVLAGVTVAVLLGLIGAILLILPHLHRHSKAVQEAIGAVSQAAQEDFAGARVWITLGRTSDRARAMANTSEEYRRQNLRLVRVRALMDLSIHTTRGFLILAMLGAGAFEASHGRISLGDLMSYLALVGIMMWPLLAVGFLAATAQRALAAADRIAEILDSDPAPGLPAMVDKRGATTAHPSQDARGTGEPPSLEVRGLHYGFQDRDTVLSGVDLTIPAGHFVGLVGPIGSGKSVLLSLLLRLREPPRGTILVDGTDILDHDPTALRSQFATAEQEPFLFSDSIRHNVAFGQQVFDPTHPAIEEAIQAVGFDTEVARFEHGLDTVVGERGTTLSGGQKQRVQLARALASGRPALVLDDALSAVDHITEAAILDRLRRGRRGRTIICVAHRLSVVRHADEIVWLEEGRVLERGCHESLLQQGGRYASTWRRQTETQALGGDP